MLISATDEGEWLTAHQSSFISGKGSTGTYWTGGWVTPSASLDMIEEKSVPLLGNEL
jgi:hypothetical protein